MAIAAVRVQVPPRVHIKSVDQASTDFFRLMASVYVLFSSSSDSFYVGSCTDLNTRLEAHRNKTYPNAFTAKCSDWALHFSIDGLKYQQAREIEAHIKRMKSKTYLINLRKYPEIPYKLRVKYKI